MVPVAIGADAENGFHTVNLVLYQPDDVLRDRVPDIKMLAAYIKRLQAICEQFFAETRTPEILDVVVAVKPGKRARVWFVSSTRTAADTQLDSLRKALEAVEPMPLRNGPVAVAISATIAGAERKLPHSNSPPYSPPIPEEWAKVADKSRTPVPDGILEILWPEKQ